MTGFGEESKGKGWKYARLLCSKPGFILEVEQNRTARCEACGLNGRALQRWKAREVRQRGWIPPHWAYFTPGWAPLLLSPLIWEAGRSEGRLEAHRRVLCCFFKIAQQCLCQLDLRVASWFLSRNIHVLYILFPLSVSMTCDLLLDKVARDFANVFKDPNQLIFIWTEWFILIYREWIWSESS